MKLTKQITTAHMRQLAFKFKDGRRQYLLGHRWIILHAVAVVHGNTLLLKIIYLYAFYDLLAIYNHHALLCAS